MIVLPAPGGARPRELFSLAAGDTVGYNDDMMAKSQRYQINKME